MTISWISPAMPGTSSSTNHGASCQSGCAIGLIGYSNQRLVSAAAKGVRFSCRASRAARREATLSFSDGAVGGCTATEAFMALSFRPGTAAVGNFSQAHSRTGRLDGRCPRSGVRRRDVALAFQAAGIGNFGQSHSRTGGWCGRRRRLPLFLIEMEKATGGLRGGHSLF